MLKIQSPLNEIKFGTVEVPV